MKIWSLGKLDRMLTTMFNNETGEGAILTHNKRSATTVSTRGRDGDLSQLLQKEKQYGRTNQEWHADMAQFRGYYVYIHDMDEQTRPVMIRDYPKVATKEQGKWPQLRPNGPGRCPFLNDPASREQAVREAERVAKEAPRTRAAAAAKQANREDTPAERPERRALAENNNLAHRRQRTLSTHDEGHVKPLDPPKAIPIKRTTSTDALPLFGSAQASLRHHPRFAGGEPVASGVQPSNVTSAIRSQMISSTAAAPGAKTGTTKKLNLLNRQVLERNSVPSNSSMSYNLNEVRAAINNERPRTSKRKAQDLAHIREEEAEHSEEEEQRPRRVIATRKKKPVEKELKPGYCENCRAKFDDFDEVGLSLAVFI